jgi:hypothetical protein
MPFSSQAQAAKFFADPKLRPLAKRWALETPSIAKLPTRVAKKPKK